MTPGEKSDWVVGRAQAEGFDRCGVAAAEKFAELKHLPAWIGAGYAGEMDYLHDTRRADPGLALAGARSLIVVALNYNTEQPRMFEARAAAGRESPRGWISRYAWGDDYHEVMREKLNRIVDRMRAQFDESFEARAYVDTGPIIERVAAKHAGLGWLAKNTCLINQQLGSWLFLGVIITTLELEPTLGAGIAPPADLCGSCTRCLDACPTDAFPEPYVLDSRRCISYLTIELRSAIPQDLRDAVGSAVIGCDICQDVCPWNRKAPFTPMPEFEPRRFAADANLVSPRLESLASMTQEDFSRAFRKSAVKRAKWRGLIRNACVALGNSPLLPGSACYARIVGLLEKLANAADPLIAEHARWALDKIQSHDESASRL